MEIGPKLKEACGVFGIYAPGEEVARVSYFGLYALQHRGQESAGIASTDGERIHLHCDMGLVSQVFDEENMAQLPGFAAIGHTRYSTTGASKLKNAQPFLVECDLGPLALAHNGNIMNTEQLRSLVHDPAGSLATSSDSEILTYLIAQDREASWAERLRDALPMVRGSYSLTLLTRDSLMAARDPWGVRPLCLGRLGQGYVIASESCALSTVGAEFLRDVLPGEILSIDADGLHSYLPESRERAAMCIFEYIYFARPDSRINGRYVYSVRRELGRELARQHPANADLVIGIPDSATVAAEGYAEESGIPYGEGLIKNRYIGRTFIQPDQNMRNSGVKLKFNPLPDNLNGKRVVLVDDSIVRGTTTKPIVELLRRAGAREVHMRVSSPPMRHPCHLGVDTATYQELIAHRLTIPEIRDYIGADTLEYLDLAGLVRATGQDDSAFCTACFTGVIPIEMEARLPERAREIQLPLLR